MSVQIMINKRPRYDAQGTRIGSTATLATGIPGSRADMHYMAAHPFVLTADSKYGYWVADQGLIINPKEGVRYSGIQDGCAVASGTPVTVATKGHFFVCLSLTSKAKIDKDTKLYANASTGALQTTTAGTAVAKVLSPVKYTAPVAAAGNTPAVEEVGAEQFKAVTENGTVKYLVIVKVELV